MKRSVRQWWALAGGLLALTAILGYFDLLWRWDLSLYDASLPKAQASSDIIIVAIDDASIARLGRWPWRRALHAELLDRLRAAGARAVALDLIFTEPDSEHPADDERLATAMRQGPPTVLPLIVDLSNGSPIEHDPLPAFVASAAGLGHEQIDLDRDGIARQVFLNEGSGRATHPHLMLALLQTLKNPAHPPPESERNPNLRVSSDAWVRDYRIFIPYLGPPGHFTRYSYTDVLEGRVPDVALKGKWILVGMTAQGGGDAYPTPTSGYSVAMPGVEINANILQALRNGSAVRRVSTSALVLFDVLPVLLACVGFLSLRPRESLLSVALLTGGALLFSFLSLREAHLWCPCAPGLFSLLLAYPIWSWLRLESAQQYMEGELRLLAAEQLPLLGAVDTKSISGPRGVDTVQARLELLRRATARVRDLRQLLADTVRGIPDATLVVDLRGEVVLANAAAEHLLGVAADGSLGSSWRDLRQSFGELQSGDRESTLELRLGKPEKDLLLRSAPFFAGVLRKQRLGTLISIVDVTELKAAQREREDVIRFLSHDLKSPASSLLGLAQLQRNPDRALPSPELADRLDGLAQRSLDLLDGFIALTQAESIDPMIFSELDLRDALQDACDEVWAAAESRGISIEQERPSTPLLLRGDRMLLARAIVNLLSNAVKFSPQDSRIIVLCIRHERMVHLTVVDQGCGISEEMEARLFRRFSREKRDPNQGPAGAGLGLAFVRVVAEKHGGSVQFERATRGSRFELRLPLDG